MEQNIKKCLNCGEVLEGSYCSNCGQKEIVSPITIKSIFSEILQVIFLIESPIVNTLKNLILRPGYFVKDYISGKRKPFIPPIHLFLLGVTVYLVLFNLISDDYFKMITANLNQDALEKSEKFGINIKLMQNYIRHNLDLLYFLQPIILAFYFKIFFAKTEINYAESLVFAIYVVSVGLYFSAIIILFSLFNTKIVFVRFLFMLIYFIYAMVQFSGENIFKSYLKAIAVFFLNYLTYGIMVAVITLVYLLLTQ